MFLIKVAALFRISKGDDPIERSEPEDETADQSAPQANSGISVATSAFRWLRKSPKSSENAIVPAMPNADEAFARDVGFFRPPDSEEELELNTPLCDDEPEEEDDDVVHLEEQTPSPDSVVTETVHFETDDDLNDLAFGFDDDDDIDDFDDLGNLYAVPAPRMPDKTSFFAEIDLNDIAQPVRRESSSAPSAPPISNAVELSTPLELTSSPADDPVVDHPVAEPLADAGEPDVPDRITPEPVLEEPVLQKASKRLQLEEQLDPPKLEEAPIAPLDASLALQPIPELQSGPRAGTDTSPKSEIEGRETDSLFSDDLQNDDSDDELEASQTEPDPAEIDMLDFEGLEIDPLEPDSSDQADDQIAEDWHAHMADVLAGNEGLDADGDLNEDTEPKSETTGGSQERAEPSSIVLPLSKTIAEIAVADEAEDDLTPLVPTYLSRTARQKSAAGQPPSTLPADDTDLSPAQLSLGIITNVPRLRRLAAAQISDELIADQLVQSVIETALADPSALQHAADLGLGLITMLYQRRQEMLKRGSTSELSPEVARAFETALCRGLAGADQFEIHQFAQAINRLDERDRGLLILVSLENLTYDQIAAIVQVPTDQIMALVSGARIHLRQALGSDDAGEDGASSAVGIPHAQEIEIHGYLDGELDGRYMADVDALVEYDEDAADRLLQYGIQGDLIRRLYAPLLNRPIPAKMLDALSTAARPARRGFGFGARRALTAGAFMIFLGGLVPFLSSLVAGPNIDLAGRHTAAESQTVGTGPASN